MRRNRKMPPALVLGLALCLYCGAGAAAQNSGRGTSASTPEKAGARNTAFLPLTRVQLFSSGVAYFEHSGTVRGDAKVALSFTADEIDDFLKSLVVWNGALLPGDGTAAGGGGAAAAAGNPAVEAPSLSYAGYAGLEELLKKYRVDLSGNPGLVEILARLRGAEVSVETPKRLSGRILAAELRKGADGMARSWVTLALDPPDSGIASFALEDCGTIRFSDPGLASEFASALDLIAANRGTEHRNMELLLPGNAGQDREAAFGYVIGAPVWKMSYRLDLTDAATLDSPGSSVPAAASSALGAESTNGLSKPSSVPASSAASGGMAFLQGWAIVDNDTAGDWKDIVLSLSSGRPVSFIQHLYPPYHVSRQELALSGIGAADAVEYESAMAAAPSAARAVGKMSLNAENSSADRSGYQSFEAAPAAAVSGQAGEAFEFTLKSPVSLAAGRSAMFAIVSSAVGAEKYSIWTENQGRRHPMLGAKLKNEGGIPLPAGSMTIYDEGRYLGDALIAYWPAGEERLIGYAEDLSVEGSDSGRLESKLESVSISGGVIRYRRSEISTTVYEFRNSSDRMKTVIVEHPIRRGDASLVEPAAALEKTASYYRFRVELPAGRTTSFIVKESWPEEESTSISDIAKMKEADFLRLCSSKAMPENAQKALAAAADLWRKADVAQTRVKTLADAKKGLVADEERIRANIESFGRTTAQGREYQKKLLELEKRIEANDTETSAARRASEEALEEFRRYISELSLN